MPVMRNADRYVSTQEYPVNIGTDVTAELLNSQDSHARWQSSHGATESMALGAAVGVAQQQLYGPDGQPYTGQSVGHTATVGAIKGLLGWVLGWVFAIAGLLFLGSLFTGNLFFTILTVLVMIAVVFGFIRLARKE